MNSEKLDYDFNAGYMPNSADDENDFEFKKEGFINQDSLIEGGEIVNRDNIKGGLTSEEIENLITLTKEQAFQRERGKSRAGANKGKMEKRVIKDRKRQKRVRGQKRLNRSKK